jgi:hypothetical protein
MKGSYLPLTANATLPTKKPPLPPTMLSKPVAGRSARGIDKLLSLLTALVTVIGLVVWLNHGMGAKYIFRNLQTTTTALAPADGPVSYLPSLAVQLTEPTFGTFLMYCEDGKWLGRTGNNIISVFSAALRAHALGMDFKIADCPKTILDLSQFSLDAGTDLSTLDIKDEINTFQAFKTFVTSTEMRIFPITACCLKKSILPPLLKNITASPAASKYHPDSLIIHIRSGDIYRTWPPPHSHYSPPPLAYYTRVIDEHQSRHSSGGGSIVIVTEVDNMSPLVDALLKIYPEGTITLQAGTLEEDVAVVLAARHLVTSQGTFAYGLAYASEQLETMYTFNKILDARALRDIDLVRYTAVLPPEFAYEWTASSEQIQYLLDFPAENLARNIVKGNKSYCNGN